VSYHSSSGTGVYWPQMGGWHDRTSSRRGHGELRTASMCTTPDYLDISSVLGWVAHMSQAVLLSLVYCIRFCSVKLARPGVTSRYLEAMMNEVNGVCFSLIYLMRSFTMVGVRWYLQVLLSFSIFKLIN
jgi:hypothetical protein